MNMKLLDEVLKDIDNKIENNIEFKNLINNEINILKKEIKNINVILNKAWEQLDVSMYEIGEFYENIYLNRRSVTKKDIHNLQHNIYDIQNDVQKPIADICDIDMEEIDFDYSNCTF